MPCFNIGKSVAVASCYTGPNDNYVQHMTIYDNELNYLHFKLSHFPFYIFNLRTIDHFVLRLWFMTCNHKVKLNFYGFISPLFR